MDYLVRCFLAAGCAGDGCCVNTNVLLDFSLGCCVNTNPPPPSPSLSPWLLLLLLLLPPI
jgi:hypothetical protein